jgi:hypothetical protein
MQCWAGIFAHDRARLEPDGACPGSIPRSGGYDC